MTMDSTDTTKSLSSYFFNSKLLPLLNDVNSISFKPSSAILLKY
jgi:hypothetical protein